MLLKICTVLFQSRPFWIHNLLRDKVKRVPAGVGKQCRVESKSNASSLHGGTFKWVLKVLGLACERPQTHFDVREIPINIYTKSIFDGR